MGLFGGGSDVSTSTQRISSFQVNQSSYGSPIKLIFGTAMTSGVLIDYTDFTAVAHTTTTESGGKGGGGVTQSNTSYTYTVAGCVALGEGEIVSVGKIWMGSKTTDANALGVTFFNGAKAQSPWGYMLSRHPDHALTYSGTSYVAGVLNLGDSASLPNMNFEVYGLCQSTAPAQYNNRSVSKTVSAQSGGQYLYSFSATLPVPNYYSMNSVAVSVAGGIRESHSYSVVENTCIVTGTFYYAQEGVAPDVNITVNYKDIYVPTVPQPTAHKMQQFAYTQEIEISNFAANRYVQEYVFDSLTGIGSWVTLDSRFYTIEQSKDAYGSYIYGTYTYTFNFDDRDDGYDRADPKYIRIYYTAIQATVDYTPTDANPRDIIYTLLTSTVYGENFPDVLIDEESLAQYSNYCKTNNLLISPVYTDRTSCSDIISSLMECTNSAYVFSQGKVKIVPYWDGLPPYYAITDANIINQGEESLRIERTSQADTYNIVPLEHTSRADQYNSNVVYATDEGDIELHGVRQAGTYSHPEIMNQSLAQAVAQLILQKQLYNRNKYTVKLGQEFILLEPMDAVTLESKLASLGITSVRVVEIKESADDFTLEITFEDNLSGVTSAPLYTTQPTDRATPYTNESPEDVNTPIFFEAPAPLVESATGYELWIYASGSNRWWGGANVWISTDGNSYRLIGTIEQPARQGNTTTALPIHATPDNENTLGVDLSMSRASLASVTKQDADDFVSLCWIKGIGNGEFISYQNANLTSQYNYDLSYLQRGVFGSTAKEHAAGSQFVRCDSNIVLKLPFSANDIGKTYYVKMTSFNVFGTVVQDLSDVPSYSVTLYGYNQKTITESGTATIKKDEPTTITYKNVYSSTPYPQVTITTGYAGDILHITNSTRNSFDCYFENSDTSIEVDTRDINYLVVGV